MDLSFFTCCCYNGLQVVELLLAFYAVNGKKMGHVETKVWM